MRLKTSIFLWVFPAAAVPLTALVLLATAYSEQRYRAEVNEEVLGSLEAVASAIERRLLIEQDLIRGLSSVPAVREFAPILSALSEGRRHPDYLARRDALSGFLKTFQSVRRSLGTVRVLDHRGNTLIKVNNGSPVPALLDGVEDVPYVEEEPGDGVFVQTLEDLFPGEVGTVLMPRRDDVSDPLGPAPIMSVVVPIEFEERIVGYFSLDPPLGPLDRMLNVAPRVHNGQLLIAEINPDNPARDGFILYDDANGVGLTSDHTDLPRLQEFYPTLYAAVFYRVTDVLAGPRGNTQIYYQEYLPYPDRLEGWVVATRIDRSALGVPFQRIRLGILSSLLVALLVGLALAQIGSRRIAGSIAHLTRRLVAYAGGERGQRVQVRGPVEMREAGEAFNFMAETLEQAEKERDEAQLAMLQSAKLASIGQMAAGIGHEINNPLGNILSLTKLIERGLPESKARLLADIRGVREEAQRASRIVRGILNFARQVPPQNTRFEVAPWIDESLALVEQVARERGVALRAVVADGLLLEGDRDLLQQTLINLLLNAVQASPRDAEVAVMAAAEGDWFRLTVRDHGPGVPEETMNDVFDPFFTTKPEGEGSGLGLSISLGIVQRHDGKLELANAPDGKGAIALLSLPLTAGNGGAPAARARS